jgi:hypothetical protein
MATTTQRLPESILRSLIPNYDQLYPLGYYGPPEPGRPSGDVLGFIEACPDLVPDFNPDYEKFCLICRVPSFIPNASPSELCVLKAWSKIRKQPWRGDVPGKRLYLNLVRDLCAKHDCAQGGRHE